MVVIGKFLELRHVKVPGADVALKVGTPWAVALERLLDKNENLWLKFIIII